GAGGAPAVDLGAARLPGGVRRRRHRRGPGGRAAARRDARPPGRRVPGGGGGRRRLRGAAHQGRRRRLRRDLTGPAFSVGCPEGSAAGALRPDDGGGPVGGARVVDDVGGAAGAAGRAAVPDRDQLVAVVHHVVAGLQVGPGGGVDVRQPVHQAGVCQQGVVDRVVVGGQAGPVPLGG